MNQVSHNNCDETKGADMKNGKKVVGIWGCGYVGGNTARLFRECTHGSVEVLCYDKFKPGIWTNPFELIDRSDYLFICLPTPMDDRGAIDLSYVFDALFEVDEYIAKDLAKQGKIVITRSTIVPGSSDIFSYRFPNLNIAFVPEFLTEKNAWEDTVNARRVIIGVDEAQVFLEVASLFRLVYPDPEKTAIVKMKRAEAEMYKYACNYMLAMSVLCANELYSICDAIGVDYEVVQQNFKLDPRICTHTQVPGPDGDFGIGGKCFPKDLHALRHLSEQNGYNPILLNKGLDFNEMIRNNRDWLDIPGAVSSCGFEKRKEISNAVDCNS